jgi:hypothetical protein
MILAVFNGCPPSNLIWAFLSAERKEDKCYTTLIITKVTTNHGQSVRSRKHPVSKD